MDWKLQHNKDVSFYQIYLQICATPVKTLALLSVDGDKLIIKFIWKDKWTRIAKIILMKKKVREITWPDFKI